ncbi:hypothetical protein ABHC39_06520 [Pediococcus acidilactici]|uniref:hypothetical protein n=1 Tax=Pediococcus acidilactici TaxID=1254 RepID=UPI00232B2176|nr:hypothetical protein [Pediococcus acidilactici]MDB8868983.1 hypothetical protein [Pediococcus acidilactici]
MKLVKIDDYTYVNPALIGAIEDGRFGANIYLAGSDKPIETLADTEKALDAIYGSEKTVDGSKSYQVSISTRCSTFTTQHVTAEQAFKYLRDLKNDQKLTINTMIETKSPLRQ